MSRAEKIIAFIISSDLYDIRPDGTVFTRVSKQGHETNTWRRLDRLDKRCNRKVMKALNGQVYVYRVIYTKFIGPIPDGMTVDHINEDSSDDRVENLQLLPMAKNISKSHKENLKRIAKSAAERRYHVRFTEDQVRAIRQGHANGMSLRQLAAEYATSKSYIAQICARKTWKSI